MSQSGGPRRGARPRPPLGAKPRGRGGTGSSYTPGEPSGPRGSGSGAGAGSGSGPGPTPPPRRRLPVPDSGTPKGGARSKSRDRSPGKGKAPSLSSGQSNAPAAKKGRSKAKATKGNNVTAAGTTTETLGVSPGDAATGPPGDDSSQHAAVDTPSHDTFTANEAGNAHTDTGRLMDISQDAAVTDYGNDDNEGNETGNPNATTANKLKNGEITQDKSSAVQDTGASDMSEKKRTRGGGGSDSDSDTDTETDSDASVTSDSDSESDLVTVKDVADTSSDDVSRRTQSSRSSSAGSRSRSHTSQSRSDLSSERSSSPGVRSQSSVSSGKSFASGAHAADAISVQTNDKDDLAAIPENDDEDSSTIKDGRTNELNPASDANSELTSELSAGNEKDTSPDTDSAKQTEPSQGGDNLVPSADNGDSQHMEPVKTGLHETPEAAGSDEALKLVSESTKPSVSEESGNESTKKTKEKSSRKNAKQGHAKESKKAKPKDKGLYVPRKDTTKGKETLSTTPKAAAHDKGTKSVSQSQPAEKGKSKASKQEVKKPKDKKSGASPYGLPVFEAAKLNILPPGHKPQMKSEKPAHIPPSKGSAPHKRDKSPLKHSSKTESKSKKDTPVVPSKRTTKTPSETKNAPEKAKKNQVDLDEEKDGVSEERLVKPDSDGVDVADSKADETKSENNDDHREEKPRNESEEDMNNHRPENKEPAQDSRGGNNGIGSVMSVRAAAAAGGDDGGESNKENNAADAGEPVTGSTGEGPSTSEDNKKHEQRGEGVNKGDKNVDSQSAKEERKGGDQSGSDSDSDDAELHVSGSDSEESGIYDRGGTNLGSARDSGQTRRPRTTSARSGRSVKTLPDQDKSRPIGGDPSKKTIPEGAVSDVAPDAERAAGDTRGGVDGVTSASGTRPGDNGGAKDGATGSAETETVDRESGFIDSNTENNSLNKEDPVKAAALGSQTAVASAPRTDDQQSSAVDPDGHERIHGESTTTTTGDTIPRDNAASVNPTQVIRDAIARHEREVKQGSSAGAATQEASDKGPDKEDSTPSQPEEGKGGTRTAPPIPARRGAAKPTPQARSAKKTPQDTKTIKEKQKDQPKDADPKGTKSGQSQKNNDSQTKSNKSKKSENLEGGVRINTSKKNPGGGIRKANSTPKLYQQDKKTEKVGLKKSSSTPRLDAFVEQNDSKQVKEQDTSPPDKDIPATAKFKLHDNGDGESGDSAKGGAGEGVLKQPSGHKEDTKTKSGKGDPGSSKTDKTKGAREDSLSEDKPEGQTSGSSGSGSVHVSTRLLTLAQRGEWTILDQVVRGLDSRTTHPEVKVVDEDGVGPLMLVVKENRLVIVERLIDLGADVNAATKDGRTPLHYAAAYAKEDVARLLINRRAEAAVLGGHRHELPLHVACSRSAGVLPLVQVLVRASGKDCRLCKDKDGAIPLFHAAESGNCAVCKELLQQQTLEQIRTHLQTTKDTVMHVASRRKDIDMARLFTDSGAQLDAKNADGLTPMHVSAWEGDENMVKYLFQSKASCNVVDKHDRTALHIAAERGHTAIVDMLVDKCRSSVSARTKDGSTLMHIASQYGHPETALAFLKKGVPLHMPNKSGALCLHAAAMMGHVNVIKALIQKGASIDAKTKDGYTALHTAVEHCRPQAVQILLGYGAQVELKGGKSKETPLHIAARVKDAEKCAEMLMKSGADVKAPQENGETALHIASRHGQLKMCQALLMEGADPSCQSKNGETPLHISVRYCHWEVTDELLTFTSRERTRLDAVLLVNQQNVEGETPMHYAAELIKQHNHHEFEDSDMIRQLLQYDGDINIQTKLTQETPLHYCARAGNSDILLEIVKHIGPGQTQAAVNKQAKNGWSPLLVASEHGHLEIVNILLKHNARVDVFDEHGKAALHLTAENGHDGVADVLLLHRAFVNAKSKLGVTPLHLAAQNGFNKLVKLLLESHNATIDAMTLAKATPLHMAALNGQMEVCNTLLKMKADANAKDVHGQTPLHLAAENDHSDVVKLFLKHRPELVTMANTDEHGMTCAHIAASKGSVAVVKELMRFNKVVVTTARNRTSDSTTLHLAASGGHEEVVKVLLEAGANATEENADGMTAIHLAARYGHINVLHILKDKVSWKVTSAKTGFTALHVSAQFGQMDFVREMLSKVPATVRSEAPHSGDSGREVGLECGLTPLHQAAQSGHEGLVRLLLNSPGVQPDAATTVHGSIALHLAAQSGHTAVVSLLLSKSTNQLHTKDKRGRTALHLAAANGHLDMVALLLGQGADIDVFDKIGWTALHLASKAGHLPVVKLLADSGANPKHETKDGKVPLCYAAANNHPDVLSYLIKKDHDTHMLMEDNKFVFDLMVLGKYNDNHSIEEFVLMSEAPVETAVKFSRQFRFLATKEKERSRDLLSAGDYCEAMATDLNALAASTNSAGMLLKSVDRGGIPFLDVLIECEQKEVVSHPSVQKYLSEVWTGHLSHWAGWKMIMLFLVMLCVPPVWLAFSLPFKHKFNKVPVIKFMSYLVSHLYLIVLFIVTVVYPLYPIWDSGDLIPHWYEWLLLAWLSGLVVSQLTNPEDRAGLGWIKVIIIAVCALGVTVHVIAFAFQDDDRLECLYIRNQFFGFALMLCFVQMMDFLSFHHLFGPWAIIIRDLMKDLMRFLVILLIFMLGFTLHLSALYQPVTAPVPDDPNLGDGFGGGGAVTESPLETFEMLFFALFGLVEPENLPPIHRNPAWALNMVKVVFGTYLIVTLIVLINLLIAMMSDTYQRIQAQSDVEWKFGRAKLFRNMNKTSATPSPLNLVTKLFVYSKVLYKYKGRVCNMNAHRYVDEEEDLDVQASGRSLDGLTASQGGNAAWLRQMVHRNTQVAPEGGYMAGKISRGPVPIEDVVDWQQVVDKYLAMRGRSDGANGYAATDRMDDMDLMDRVVIEKETDDGAAA